jgi:hypothetical protein
LVTAEQLECLGADDSRHAVLDLAAHMHADLRVL